MEQSVIATGSWHRIEIQEFASSNHNSGWLHPVCTRHRNGGAPETIGKLSGYTLGVNFFSDSRALGPADD